MQTTVLKKKNEALILETVDPKKLINDGALQVKLALDDLRHGRVHLFHLKAPKVKK